MSLSEELVELGFEPGTLVPDPLDAFTTRCSVILAVTLKVKKVMMDLFPS